MTHASSSDGSNFNIEMKRDGKMVSETVVEMEIWGHEKMGDIDTCSNRIEFDLTNLEDLQAMSDLATYLMTHVSQGLFAMNFKEK